MKLDKKRLEKALRISKHLKSRLSQAMAVYELAHKHGFELEHDVIEEHKRCISGSIKSLHDCFYNPASGAMIDQIIS